MKTVLWVAGLRREYGETVAVESVSFQVGAGEVVGLLGPNGAGKTTTISMILGVLAPSAGTIRIDGADIARERSRALARPNFAAVYAPLPGNLTVAQNLRIFGLLYGVHALPQRIDALLAQLDLQASALIKDPELSRFSGRVSDSGEGRWTIKAAIDEGVPAHVLSSALYERFSSRGEADFADKLLSAMQSGFGFFQPALGQVKITHLGGKNAGRVADSGEQLGWELLAGSLDCRQQRLQAAMRFGGMVVPVPKAVRGPRQAHAFQQIST